MNQKLQELKQQAGINDNPDQEGLDLFAHLIIEECRIALKPMLRDMIGRGHAYDLIKEHFKVNK
jgi:hypothetical protein